MSSASGPNSFPVSLSLSSVANPREFRTVEVLSMTCARWKKGYQYSCLYVFVYVCIYIYIHTPVYAYVCLIMYSHYTNYT